MQRSPRVWAQNAMVEQTMKTVTAFEFSDLGVNHAQYFQGAGTAFTDWDEVFVGIGDTAREAAEDALEQVAISDLEVELEMDHELIDFDDTSSAHEDCDEQDPDCLNCIMESGPCGCHVMCELQHYVALFVRYADE